MTASDPPDEAGPKDFFRLTNERCDLDFSFASLESYSHFHTETVRGRIRTLQLRPKEAWEHFSKAEALLPEFPRTLRNTMRAFYLRVYRFENALLECAFPDAQHEGVLKGCLDELLQGDLPTGETGARIQRFLEGVYLIHEEEYAKAREILERLLEASWKVIEDARTGYLFCAAIASRELGLAEESERRLQSALLSIPAINNTCAGALYAGTAFAILKFWGSEQEAEEWHAYLEHMKVPQRTIDIFNRRSELLYGRSLALKRVYIF